MTPEALASLRRRLLRLWVFSPERLWLLSISLRSRRHWILAFAIKQLNTVLYRNSLAADASVSPDVRLGHYSFGVVVDSNVVIGQRVHIWHNVTLTVRSRSDTPAQIVIEDDVKIGANAVVIPARGESLRIGRGARIGAGTVVTHDVPAGATVVAQAPRVIPKAARSTNSDELLAE